jgi:hypothetical protein
MMPVISTKLELVKLEGSTYELKGQTKIRLGKPMEFNLAIIHVVQ